MPPRSIASGSPTSCRCGQEGYPEILERWSVPDYGFRNWRKNDRNAVTWEPFTAEHAIERVRIAIHFVQPIQPKQIQAFSAPIEARRTELGLTPRMAVQMNIVEMDQNTGDARVLKQPGGWNFSTIDADGQTTEALVLNSQSLLYEATTYTRWEAFWTRYNAISEEVRSLIQAGVNVRAVALEYVDRFAFDGAALEARPGALIREVIVGSLPESVLSGREAWHVHRGWFEGEPPHRFLVNQNIEAQVIRDEQGTERRGVGILTKVELQSSEADLDISTLSDEIMVMHDVSKRVMTDALVEEMSRRVGLLDDV